MLEKLHEFHAVRPDLLALAVLLLGAALVSWFGKKVGSEACSFMN